jgi:hypothetical protein
VTDSLNRTFLPGIRLRGGAAAIIFINIFFIRIYIQTFWKTREKKMGLVGSTVWSYVYAVIVVIMLVILTYLGWQWFSVPSWDSFMLFVAYGIGTLITYSLAKTLMDCKNLEEGSWPESKVSETEQLKGETPA